MTFSGARRTGDLFRGLAGRRFFLLVRATSEAHGLDDVEQSAPDYDDPDTYHKQR